MKQFGLQAMSHIKLMLKNMEKYNDFCAPHMSEIEMRLP